MSLHIEQFAEFFDALYRTPGSDQRAEPFPWQTRLALQVFNEGWPACIDLPTASGKTTTIDIAIFVLAAQADRKDHERTVGRRIFFAVNRRVIVDEAFRRAHGIAVKLYDKKTTGILKQVADALRRVNGDNSAPPLDVAELRGGIYRDRRWARSITQPLVVATTADQIGSRLLFRGYGVSPAARPIHAALVACDSTILLDEAHCTKAFSQTLEMVRKYRAAEKAVPKMQFVQMTATPTVDCTKASCFSLDNKDYENDILRKRQNAAKPARLISTKAKSEKFAAEMAVHAIEAQDDLHRAVGVIVNRVQTARDIFSNIREKRPAADCYLVIGRMRPHDRDVLTEALRTVVGSDRPAILPRPCFVVATQCLEVGADYDFDALVTECASIDALRQRAGRLNRRGRDILAKAVIVASEPALKGDDPVYGESMAKTWDWLKSIATNEVVDFGIAAFKPHWESLKEADREKLLAPSEDAAAILPSHLDALCQTMPEPTPSPDVSFFIHGPQRTNTEVQVCWRADLNESTNWGEVVSLLPPMSAECMTVPLAELKRWMSGENRLLNDADAPARDEINKLEASGAVKILIWRGVENSCETSDPRNVTPGNTVVIPVSAGGWNVLGHIPNAPTDPKDYRIVDIAESAVRISRRQIVLRLHPDIWPEKLTPDLRDFAISAERSFPRETVRAMLRMTFDEDAIPEKVLKRPFDEHSYLQSDEGRAGVLLRFRELIPDTQWLLPEITAPDDDIDDPLLNLVPGEPIPLETHTRNVIRQIDASLEKLSLPQLASTLRRAAELHDIGKCDPRFQAMLLRVSPEESLCRSVLFAKSNSGTMTKTERSYDRKRARLPKQFRHELLSVELLENASIELDESLNRDLLLHSVGSHHGNCRPLAPIMIDASTCDLDMSTLVTASVSSDARRAWTPSHRMDSGVSARFWSLTRAFGWWGLAYVESVLRLADQRASEIEQQVSAPEGRQ